MRRIISGVKNKAALFGRSFVFVY